MAATPLQVRVDDGSVATLALANPANRNPIGTATFSAGGDLSFSKIEAAGFDEGLELARGPRPVFMGSEELRHGIRAFKTRQSGDEVQQP